jgi:hypothetical protein
MLLFNPANFTCDEYAQRIEAAKIANKILDLHLRDCPMVFGQEELRDGDEKPSVKVWRPEGISKWNVTGRVFITEKQEIRVTVTKDQILNALKDNCVKGEYDTYSILKKLGF